MLKMPASVMASALLLALIVPVLCHSNTYVIGVERLKYMPYYDYQGNEYIGFSRELLDLFSQYSGHKLEYRILPVKRLFNEFFSKEVDFKFPDNSYWQSQRRQGLKIHYSDAVVKYIDGLMVLANNKGRKLSKIKNMGVVSGFTPWSYLDEINKKQIKVTEKFTITGILNQVILKRIDGAYINVDVAKHQLQAVMNQEGKLLFDDSLPFTASHYFLSSLKYPDVIKEFNRFLKENRTKIDRLKIKHNILR